VLFFWFFFSFFFFPFSFFFCIVGLFFFFFFFFLLVWGGFFCGGLFVGPSEPPRMRSHLLSLPKSAGFLLIAAEDYAVPRIDPV